jgi:curli biogenesis system outer membrane secretion channel CsgG
MNTFSKIAAIAIIATAIAPAAFAQSDKDKKGKAKVEDLSLPPYKGPKKRIAIAPMDIPKENGRAWDEAIRVYKGANNINTISDVGNSLTSMLTTALHETGRFILLERQDFGDIVNEMKIGEEFGNEKTAVKKGNVLGAQMIVRATITEFVDNGSSKAGGVSISGFSVGGSTKESKVTLDLKFFDPSTSRVLHVAKASGSSKSEAMMAGVTFGSVGLFGGGSNTQPIEKATRDAILRAVKAIVDKMDKMPWEARVAKVDAGKITISRGSQDGVNIGDIFAVYKPGEEIKDPETGESLGRDEDVYIGDCRITWAGDKLARAEMMATGKPGVNYVLKTKS